MKRETRRLMSAERLAFAKLFHARDPNGADVHRFWRICPCRQACDLAEQIAFARDLKAKGAASRRGDGEPDLADFDEVEMGAGAPLPLWQVGTCPAPS